MKKFKNAVSWAVRIAVLTACGAASAFLIMSGYEAVYNRSLPLVHTVDPINLNALANSYELQDAAALQQKRYGTFGKPATVKMPDRAARFNVVEPISQGDEWLSRANALHLMLPTQARSGNIGVALMYCRAGFRTINAQNLPTIGSNIFMDTDQEWRYVYKVTSAKVFPDSVPYVTGDTGTGGKLVISCNDAANHTNVIIEANLLSVQGVAS